MRKVICVMVMFLSTIAIQSYSQEKTSKKYRIKYEAEAKPGESIMVIAKTPGIDGVSQSNGIAQPKWTYYFETDDVNQNVEITTMRATGGFKSKVWAKVSIFVNDKLVATKEGKFSGNGIGHSLQVNLADIQIEK